MYAQEMMYKNRTFAHNTWSCLIISSLGVCGFMCKRCAVVRFFDFSTIKSRNLATPCLLQSYDIFPSQQRLLGNIFYTSKGTYFR